MAPWPSSRTPGRPSAAGLLEPSRELERQGVADPLWFEVPKSRKAPAQCSARSTRAPSSSSSGAVTGWCSVASTHSHGAQMPLAIVPAGTANLFASNLDIPRTSRGRSRSDLKGRAARSMWDA